MRPTTTPTVWPSARDPRVIVHRDRPGAWVGRWLRRSATHARALATEILGATLPRWPYCDPSGLLAAMLLLGGAIAGDPMASTGGEGQPVQAYVNFIVQAVIMIVAIIVAVALAPKPPQPKPAALADFDAPTAEEGKPYAKVFGDAWINDPNVLWYGDLSSEPIRKKGGKK